MTEDKSKTPYTDFTFPNAKLFLASALPWGMDWCNLIWMTKELNERGKPFVNGRAYQNLSEMINGLAFYSKSENVRDFFCTMSSQLLPDVKVSKAGKPYNAALRLANNAVALKSLFIDIDVKEGAYANTIGALNALHDFVQAFSLPKPSALVASGSGGLHVHWFLDTPLPRDEWLVLAHALAAAIKDFKLHADTGCTIDSARILRIPDTFNYKSDPPKPVSLLSPRAGTEVFTFTAERIRRSIEKFVGVTPIPSIGGSLAALPRRAPISDGADDSLGAGIEEGPRPDLDIAADKCGFISGALGNRGADLTQPLWFLAGSLTGFTTNGVDDFIRMSDGHSGYDVDDAVATYDRIQRGKNGAGWPKCATIANSGCASCATCPMLALGKSPLNFGLPVTPEVMLNAIHQPPMGVAISSMGEIPVGYIYQPSGHVTATKPDPEGNTIFVQVCDYPMINGWIEGEQNNILNFTTVIANRKRIIRLPLAAITGKELFSKTVSEFGFAIKEQQVKATKEFMVAWVQKLQHIKEAVISTEPFGWVYKPGDNGVDGFAYAGSVWGPGGRASPAAFPDAELAKIYEPHGDLVPWTTVAKIITDQQRPELDAIMASAFGAPLMGLTGHAGVLLSAYSSESGIGKSTAMIAGQAVWGHPVSGMQMLNDTSNSTAKRMGIMRQAPLFWDELKGHESAEKFVQLVFQATGGREKFRMKSDASLARAGEWQTMMISAANMSLTDTFNEVVRDGGSALYRFFEYQVHKGIQGQVSSGMVTRAVDKLRRNHGQAGLVYAQFLGANFDRVKRETSDMYDALNKHLSGSNPERFWIAAMTAVLMGAKYANELLLTTIDEKRLFQFLVSTLQEMRRLTSGESVMHSDSPDSVRDLISQFLTESAVRKTVITDTTHTGPGRPHGVNVQIINDVSKVDEVMVHRVFQDKLIYIRCTPFHKWLKNKKLPERATTKMMVDKMGVRKIRRALALGTGMQTGQEYVYELDLQHSSLVDVL